MSLTLNYKDNVFSNRARSALIMMKALYSTLLM